MKCQIMFSDLHEITTQETRFDILYELSLMDLHEISNPVLLFEK